MLNRVYELETAVYHISTKEAELKEAVSQAKFNLRQAKIAQVEYSGIRAFLDKLSGKYGDKAETFSREVRKAEAELSSLQRQLQEQQQKLSSLKEQRASLPPTHQLRTDENAPLWAKLESRYCAVVLLPLLEKLEEALTEYRRMLRGEFPMLSIDRQQSIGAAPIDLAEECVPLLQRLDNSHAGVEPGTFFRSPAGFLAAAARHNQLEQAAAADSQTRQLKKQLTQLLSHPD